MGGVDLRNGLLCHYSTARNRMKRFYMKIFRHLLDTTVLNFFIAYKQLGGTKARVEFIITLAEDKISTYKPIITIPTSSAGRSLATVAKPIRLTGRHFPDYCPSSEKKARPLHRCIQCQKQKKEQKFKLLMSRLQGLIVRCTLLSAAAHTTIIPHPSIMVYI